LLASSRSTQCQQRRYGSGEEYKGQKHDNHATSQSAVRFPHLDVQVVSSVAGIANDRAIAQTTPREPLRIDADFGRRPRALACHRADALERGDDVSLLG
jgi:hypothetical protein